MNLKTFKTDGSSSGEQDFSVPEFEGNRGHQAIKEVVTAIRANNRFGTVRTKTRGDKRGGGRKPFRQKGTGMARRGSSRSPLLRGGGVAMGPKPRDYTKKVNKKVKTLAFQRSVFDRVTDGDIYVIDSFEVAEPKTKLFINVLKQIVPASGSILIVDVEFADPVIMAARNIPAVDLEEAPYLNTLQLALYDHIVITKAGLEILIERMETTES